MKLKHLAAFLVLLAATGCSCFLHHQLQGLNPVSVGPDSQGRQQRADS